MRVLYAFPEPLPLPRARGLQVVKTAEALAEAGEEVILAHVPADGENPFVAYGVRPPDRASTAAIPRSLSGFFHRIGSMHIFAHRLSLLVAESRPDLVMVRHIRLAAMLRKRFPGLALVYEAHEVFADTAAPARRTRVSRNEAQAMRAADSVIANSGATARRLSELYGGLDIHVIPNGVDWDADLPAKEWASARQRVVYTGSLFPWKGVEDLLIAAAHLPGYRITIAGGDARELDKLRAVVGRQGAEIVLLGRLGHAEVLNLLAQSCIAVLPNRADPESAFTSPLKLFEYMAAGCAIVASDLPAVREILAPQDASFVPPGNPQALADAIRGLAEAPEKARAMGERLREKAREHTWTNRGKRVAAVLQRAVQRCRTGR